MSILLKLSFSLICFENALYKKILNSVGTNVIEISFLVIPLACVYRKMCRCWKYTLFNLKDVDFYVLTKLANVDEVLKVLQKLANKTLSNKDMSFNSIHVYREQTSRTKDCLLSQKMYLKLCWCL
jgi:hypothetical protein